MTTNRRVVDVDAVLDGIRFRGLPLIVMLCAVAILALDGLDIQVIGLVAPALTKEFGIARPALAPVLAASIIGMALGALAVGPVGDRWGRRTALLISTLLFGGGTLLASTATSIDVLALWRLLTGIGLGGALPNATALMAEFAPPRWRSQAIAAAVVGVPIGGMIGAAIAAEVIPASGWRAVFVIGGVLPLLWLAVMYFVVPESPRYLAARGDRPRDLAMLLNRIESTTRYTGEEAFVLGSRPSLGSSTGIGSMFSSYFIRDTLAAWAVFGTNVFAVYAFFNWAPVVLTSLGLKLTSAVRAALLFNFAGVVGSLLVSSLVPRFGSRWLLATCAIVGTLSLAYLAWITQATAPGVSTGLPLVALLVGVALAGFNINAIQVGMYAVVAHVYPTPSRSTGVGWALGMGRLGGILSSFAGGILMGQKGGEHGFFLGIACVLILTLAGILALRNHIPALFHANRSRASEYVAAQSDKD